MLTYALCLSVLNAIFSRGAVIEGITESPAEAPLEGHWGIIHIQTSDREVHGNIGVVIEPLEKHLQFSVHMKVANLMTFTMDCDPQGNGVYACKTTPMTTTYAMGSPDQMRDEAFLAGFFNQEPKEVVISLDEQDVDSLHISKGDARLSLMRRHNAISDSPVQAAQFIVNGAGTEGGEAYTESPAQVAYPLKGSWGITKSTEGEFEGVAVQIDNLRETANGKFKFSMNMRIANSMTVRAECQKPVSLDYGLFYKCNKLSFRSTRVMGSPEDMEKERRFETLFGKMRGKNITLSHPHVNIDMIRLTGDDASLTLNRDTTREVGRDSPEVGGDLHSGEAPLEGHWGIIHIHTSDREVHGDIGVVIEPLDKHLQFSVQMRVANLMTLTMDCDPQGNGVYACKTTPVTTTYAMGSPDQMRDEAFLARFFNQEPKEVVISPDEQDVDSLHISKGDARLSLMRRHH